MVQTNLIIILRSFIHCQARYRLSTLANWTLAKRLVTETTDIQNNAQ